jgi:hypothetical protein
MHQRIKKHLIFRSTPLNPAIYHPHPNLPLSRGPAFRLIEAGMLGEYVFARTDIYKIERSGEKGVLLIHSSV